MATAAEPFMLTPLVIAMPKPMADALGYPETPIGYADILRLANDPEGWGAYGHPEWGPFLLGKTNPNFSTSALSSTIAQYYAATGKTADLSLEDLNRPEVQQFARGVESAVVHYGDITMTFLNNWFRNDVRGTSLTYVSAVAVEEKSVIDYNKGNPDGVLSPGEEPASHASRSSRSTRRRARSTATTRSSSSTRRGSTTTRATAREQFEEFIKRPEAQQRVLEFGFRPGQRRRRDRRSHQHGVGCRSEPAADAARGAASPRCSPRSSTGGRRTASARASCCSLDVSGSMGDPADPNGAPTPTKLDLAKIGRRRRARRVRGRRRRRVCASSRPSSGDRTERLAGPRPHRPARRSAGGDRPRASTTCSRSTARRSTPRRATPTTTCSATSTRRASTRSSCSATAATRTRATTTSKR